MLTSGESNPDTEVVPVDKVRKILLEEIDRELDVMKARLHELVDRLLETGEPIVKYTQAEIYQKRALADEAEAMQRLRDGNLSEQETQTIGLLREQVLAQGVDDISDETLLRLLHLKGGFRNYASHASVGAVLLERFGTGETWKMEELIGRLNRAKSTIQEKLSTIRNWLSGDKSAYELRGNMRSGWSIIQKKHN